MYDLHTHSLLSDGVLLPSEMAARYAAYGYKAIAITDHCDYANIKSVIASILEFTSHWPRDAAIQVLSGVELTHLPLEQFKPLSGYARAQGIQVIVGHGQTPVEPVLPGTNRAALEADIDVLAHPGLITEDEVKLAKTKGIFLEVTARKGHRQGNAHVVKLAKSIGAPLAINTDFHAPSDLLSFDERRNLALMNGIGLAEYDGILEACGLFIQKKLGEKH
jgi:putative hydrolase